MKRTKEMNCEITWVGLKSSDIMVLLMHLSKVKEMSLRKKESNFILYVDPLNLIDNEKYIKYNVHEIETFVKYFPNFGIKIEEFDGYITIKR